MLSDGEDNLLHSVGVGIVVTHEECSVVVGQIVRRVDNHLGVSCSIGPASSTGVNLSVQVETREEQPSSSAVNAVVHTCTGFAHVALHLEQLLLKESKDVGTLSLFG